MNSVIALCGAIVVGMLLVQTRTSGAPPSTSGPVNSREIEKLQQDRIEELRAAANDAAVMFQTGSSNITFEKVYERKQMLLQAELDAADTPRQRVTVLRSMLASARDLEQHVQQQEQHGNARPFAVHDAKVAVLDAEIALAKEPTH